jgi:hypothetical protein
LPANKDHLLPPDQHIPPLPYRLSRQTSPRDLQVECHPLHRTRRDHLHPHRNRGSRPLRRWHLNHNLHQPQFSRAVHKFPHPRQRLVASQVTMRPTGDRLRIRNPREPGLRVMRQPLRYRHKQHNLRQRRGVRYLRPRKVLRFTSLLRLTLRSIKDLRQLGFPRARNNPFHPRTPGACRTSHTLNNTAPLLHQPGNNHRRPSRPNRNRNRPLLPT